MTSKNTIIIALGVVIVAIIILGIGGVSYAKIAKDKKELEDKVKDQQVAVDNMQNEVKKVQDEKNNLLIALDELGKKNASFTADIEKIASNAETLERLT